MIVKRTATAALVSALAVGTAAMLDAQGRRGGGPAGGAPAAGARTGTVEHITVHGTSLEGNLEADSPDRDVTVYLPPSYAGDQARRYPVVYLLHGYGGRDDTFTSRLAKLPESADRLAAAQGFSELIVVMPNAFSLHKGSMYSNSVTTGDWESFVAKDLVAYVDGHYRTLPNRMSRGLAGHSMGGYGAVRIGMKRPDVFSSLYIMSACCLTANANPRPEAMAPAEAIKTREQAEEAARAPRVRALRESRVGGGVVAESQQPAALPRSPGQGRQGAARHRREMGGQRPTRDAQAVRAGPEGVLRDRHRGRHEGQPGRVEQRLHEAMTRLNIAHSYEEYDGDHTNKVGERIERNVLPFFSKSLVSPANPTSPGVRD